LGQRTTCTLPLVVNKDERSETVLAKKGIKSDGYKYMYLLTAVICVVIAVIITLLLVFGNLFSDDGSSPEVIDESIPQAESVDNTSLDVSEPDTSSTTAVFKEHSVQNNTLSEGELILLKSGSVAPDKSSLDLVNIYSNKASGLYSLSTTKLFLNREALTAFDNMIQDFVNATGDKNLMINDAYTSIEDIESRTYISDYADLASGRTVRLAVYPQNKGKMGSGVYLWIADHCQNYGYILRYPSGKEDITGIEENPSIFRYVGVIHAMYMKENNLCLDEYIDFIKQYDYENPLLYNDIDAQQQYYIYFQEMANTSSTVINIPEDKEYMVSGNNNDGFIITYVSDNTE